MHSPFSRFRGEDDLDARVAHLASEMSSLRKALSRRGLEAYGDASDTASDLYSEFRERFGEALPAVRQRARDVGEVARHHPASTAVVGLVVVGLLAALFARGSGGADTTRRSKR